MQYTSVPPFYTCYYPIPNHSLNDQYLRLPLNKFLKKSTQIPPFSNHHNSLTTHYVTTNSRNQNNQEFNNPEDPAENLTDLYSVSKTQNPNSGDFENSEKVGSFGNLEEFENSEKVGSFDDLGEFGDLGILSNMSWVEFKAALGQRINFEGIGCSVGILAKDNHLAIPNLGVNDIRFIDWGELKRRGFRGIVFDKDNTLTIPYNLSLWGPLGESFEQCRSLFGDNVAVFSNSAGLYEYDPDGRKANVLERSIGIKVIKHRVKKPAGTAEDIERHFGCESSKLIMVGDRPFTDIVYGNRNGFLTILTKPLSVAEEPFIVKQMRILEVALVNHWCRKGLKATNHRLLPQPKQCIKEQPW